MISPLELLLPKGVVRRIHVLGTGAAAGLASTEAAVVDTDADLVLLLPRARELARRSWLPQAISAAAEIATSDGAVYAVLPRRSRARATRLLRHAGFSAQTAVAHLPARKPRYLVPLDRGPWNYAFEYLIASSARLRLALRLIGTLPMGARLLQLTLPGLGIVARRSDAIPLAGWVRAAASAKTTPGSAVVGRSWRGPDGAVIVHCLGARQTKPWAVAKATPGLSAEGDALDRFGRDAEVAGARVPHTLAQLQRAGSSITIQTFVDGTSAARVLARVPARFPAVAQSVVDWLAVWNARTAIEAELDAAYLERHVRDPFDIVKPALQEAQPYDDFLRDLCDRVEGTVARLVAAHNDLTMWNVMVDRHNHIGVVDWETADSGALPLSDFFYAMVDAFSATTRYASRRAASAACFTPDGAATRLVSPLQRQFLSRVSANAEIVQLSYHACWLRHARNSMLANRSTGEFVDVVQLHADLSSGRR
jgi:hypothetical protein